MAFSACLSLCMAQHARPSGDCLVCYEELTDDTYAEYRVSAASPWLPAKFCTDCIQTVLDTKFDAYINGVANSTCEAELKRYMIKGPPIYIEDPTGFPVQDGMFTYPISTKIVVQFIIVVATVMK
jgi:hypothetical protein